MIIRWQPHIGQYLHHCDECASPFDGRKNKRFCGLKCKGKHHNDIAAIKQNEKLELTSNYLRNIEIVKNELADIGNDIITVSTDRLRAFGFDPEGPNTRFSMGGETWYRIGPVAYRPIIERNEVELFKIENRESFHNS
jgi:hypothetical protein